MCQITHAESVKTQKPRRGGPATKRHSKRKDAKTWLSPFLDHRQHLPWEARRSGRIHEERKKAGKDLLAEPEKWAHGKGGTAGGKCGRA